MSFSFDRPYRAPELLFGPKSYNAFSTDLWSLGATLSELFTPLRLILSSSDGGDDDEDDTAGLEEDKEAPSFIYPPSPTPDKEYKWERNSLFNGNRSELGLLWSIFKTMGTPNESNWPVG
jgi:serine/threonine protein kinase